MRLTTLGRTKVLARGGRTGSGTTGLLNAESAALDDLALETILGGVGHVGSDHLDEAEATRLPGVGVLHDLALLDLAILLEEAGDLGLLETGVDAGDEEVGAGVDGTIVILVVVVVVLGRGAV